MTLGRFELPYFASEAKTLSIELQSRVLYEWAAQSNKNKEKPKWHLTTESCCDFSLGELQAEV